MIDACPHCGQRMLVRHGVQLSPKLADIFDAIERCRSFGISKEELATMFYGASKNPREAKKALAIAIHHINERFDWMEVPLRIENLGHNKPYRLTGRP